MFTHLEAYTLIKRTFDNNYFENFEELFTYTDNKAKASGLKLDFTLSDVIENKKNPNPNFMLSELYFTFKHSYKEFIEIYNLSFPYILTNEFRNKIDQIAQILKLSAEKKELVLKALTNYSADTWLEEAMKRFSHRTELNKAFDEEFSEEFKSDINQLINKYKKKYPTPMATAFFDLLEVRVISDAFEKSFNEINKSDDLDKTAVAMDSLKAYQNKRGRPKSARYDELLLSLKELLTDQSTGAYMPKLIYVLKLFKETENPLFNDFEINENSLRVKLSKLKVSPPLIK